MHAAFFVLFCVACSIHVVDSFWFERGARHTNGRVVDIRDFGALPNASDAATAVANAAAINTAFSNLTAGDTLLVPAEFEFYTVGGLLLQDAEDVTLQINGTLNALDDFEHWPVDSQGGSFLHFLSIVNSSHITLQGPNSDPQSLSKIDGRGKKWWNAFILGTLKYKRPKLIMVVSCKNMLVQDILLHSSPSFHLDLSGVVETEVGNVTVITDRQDIRASKAVLRQKRGYATNFTGEPGLEPEDLNTDGIDPSGEDIWIHDCHILNDDDSIAVKPCANSTGRCAFSSCSQNMLIEDMVMTGGGTMQAQSKR